MLHVTPAVEVPRLRVALRAFRDLQAPPALRGLASRLVVERKDRVMVTRVCCGEEVVAVWWDEV
jgi:hypothetical protein